jgi:hypothetical protein
MHSVAQRDLGPLGATGILIGVLNAVAGGETYFSFLEQARRPATAEGGS